MALQQPNFRKHKDGRYLTKWGNRNRYFGRDLVTARRLYAASIEEWQAWRSARHDYLKAAPVRKRYSVQDIVDKFLGNKFLEGGDSLEGYYVKHLRRFTHMYGGARADEVTVAHLQSVKNDMLKAEYAPKTINHDTIAVKAVFRWAEDQELVPAVNLRGCKTMPLGPPPDRSWTVERCREMIDTAPYPLKPWLAVAYLSLARPSEMIRLVHGEGHFVETGIFRLDRGKMDKRVTFPRHLVLSDLALTWLQQCEPVWSRLDSYYGATARVFGHGGSHPLRHSAATHLAQQEVDRATIDLLLGHSPGRVSLIYARMSWPPLRRKAALLSL